MNLEELKTVLTDIVSSLEMVLQGLQSGDQAQTEEPAEALIESLNKAKAILAKAEEPATGPEKPKEDEDMAKTMKELLACLKGGSVQKESGASKEIKTLAEEVKVMKDAMSEMLSGFGIKEEPAAPVQKGLNAQGGQEALIGLLADLLVEKSASQTTVRAGGNPIRENLAKELAKRAGGPIMDLRKFLKSGGGELLKKALTSSSNSGGALVHEYLEDIITDQVISQYPEWSMINPKKIGSKSHKNKSRTARSGVGGSVGENATLTAQNSTYDQPEVPLKVVARQFSVTDFLRDSTSENLDAFAQELENEVNDQVLSLNLYNIFGMPWLIYTSTADGINQSPRTETKQFLTVGHPVRRLCQALSCHLIQ